MKKLCIAQVIRALYEGHLTPAAAAHEPRSGFGVRSPDLL